MKTVFADAFYFVGLINRTDQHHRKVVAAARQLRDAILTTEWILAEFADALAESTSRQLVPAFFANWSKIRKRRSSQQALNCSIVVSHSMKIGQTKIGR